MPLSKIIYKNIQPLQTSAAEGLGYRQASIGYLSVGLYARNLLARQLGITTAPQLPAASRDAAWQMPDVLRATVDARRAMFDFPADISPEISAALNHRLRSL